MPDSTVSPATINKELRHLKAVLRKAHEWGYLPKMPEVPHGQGAEEARRCTSPPSTSPPSTRRAMWQAARRRTTTPRPTGGGPC